MPRFVCFILSFVVLSFPALAEGNSPALWKLSDEDTNIHILGSIHLLKPGTVWLNDELQTVISEADILYLELSPEQQAPEVMQPLILRYGILPEGDALRNHLPEESYAALSQALIELGVPEQIFSRMKPWMAAILYAVQKFAELGYDPAAGVDATIMSLVQARGGKIEGLETAEFQISLFDGLVDYEEAQMVEDSLEEGEDTEQVMEKMTAAWISGNLSAMESLLNKSFEDEPEMKEKLLFSRNRNWMGKVKTILDQPGNYLLVVGAGHLVGEGSLIELLDQEGLALSRVH